MTFPISLCVCVCRLVLAVMGRNEGGTFVVEDWCTAGLPPQPAFEMNETVSEEAAGQLSIQPHLRSNLT